MEQMNEMTDEWIEERQVTGNIPVLQVRTQAAMGVLHLQGYGMKANREYGCAYQFHVPHEVNQWLMAQDTDLYPSLASGKTLLIYIRNVSINEYRDGYQLFIAKADSEANFDDGYRLDMNADKPSIMALIDFANNNDLINTIDEDRPVIEEGEEE
tara:strand:- start:3833 stop:4297 length:465 start_codon:yes stop_codon:yes gene_type:complete